MKVSVTINKQVEVEISEYDLSKILENWFKEHNNRKRNFWSENEVARILKYNLKRWSNFKRSPNKNP